LSIDGQHRGILHHVHYIYDETYPLNNNTAESKKYAVSFLAEMREANRGIIRWYCWQVELLLSLHNSLTERRQVRLHILSRSN